MKKIISYMISLFFLGLTQNPILYAETKKSDNTNPIDEIKKIDNSIKTLSADFEQEILFKTAELKQKVEGSLVFLKPGNLKITHTKPQNQIIIIRNRKDLTIVKHKDKQIITTTWDKWKTNLEPRLKGLLELGDYTSLAEKEDVKLIKDEDKNTIIITSKKNIYSLKIILNKENIPLKAEFDIGDTLITTIFKNVELNKEIKEGEFKYKNKDNYETLSL